MKKIQSSIVEVVANKTCPLPPGSHVWVYLRVSGDEQADRGLPIAGQRQHAQEYADQFHLIITRWFVDEAKSAGSTVGRDAFNDMVYLARQKPRPGDAILLWDIKRFARNLLDSQFYKADLRRRGWELIFLSDQIPETDFAPVYEALLEWKAEKDRSDIGKDTQRGLQTLAKLGYAPGGFPPRGYTAETLTVEIEGRRRQVRHWVPDPQWWDLARKAWEMRAAGDTRMEILTATGLYHNTSSLSSFFGNETYLGIRKCGDLKIEDAHEPLITREIWEAVQKRRQRYTLSGAWKDHPRRVNSRYLLSGLLHCAQCGALMSGSYTPYRKMADGTRAEWRFYICTRKKAHHPQTCPSSRLKAEKIEDAVVDTLVRTVLTPDHLEHLAQEANRALSSQRQELTQRQKRLGHSLRQLEQRVGRLLDALERGESGAIRSRLDDRERERAHLLAQLEDLNEQMRRSRIDITPGALRKLAEDMHQVLKSGNVAMSRRILHALIVRIEADREGGVLYYTFPFPSSLDSDTERTRLAPHPISLSSPAHCITFHYT